MVLLNDGYLSFTAKMELAIEEYSFSQTTLEQVYLKFAQVTEEAESNEYQQQSLWYNECLRVPLFNLMAD